MEFTQAFSIDSLNYFYRDLPFKATLYGIYTRTAETREKAAREFGFAKVYESQDEMINYPTIDIIDITTPSIAHFETINKAIAAVKHIYCEKPLCISEAETTEAARLAREAGVTCQTLFNARFFDAHLCGVQVRQYGMCGGLLA